MNREIRIEIARQTLDILGKGFYINQHQQRIDIGKSLEKALKKSLLFRPEQFDDLDLKAEKVIESRNENTIIEIKNESTLDAVLREVSLSDNIACLNFASAKNPGGGFLNGSQAQEESLARATGLYPCISQMQEMYVFNRNLETCLYSDYMIFSPLVPVIRNGQDELLDSFREVSVITAPAVNAGVVKLREPENVALIESIMDKRISMVLNIALINQMDTLILGAWGCGVFQNDPEMIAELFARHLLGKYRNAFKKITFAILDNPKKAMIEKFEHTFNG
jgi:uncharacterized protein (TIGR02452 family)